MGWGGAVGVAVGLAAPSLLAATVVGAAAGGVMGKFVDHRIETQMHDKIGENLPPGSAGIIAIFDDEQRLTVEQALPGALAKSVAQSDKKELKALKDGLAEAMGKFVQDRTVLPIADRDFGGVMAARSISPWSTRVDITPAGGDRCNVSMWRHGKAGSAVRERMGFSFDPGRTANDI